MSWLRKASNLSLRKLWSTSTGNASRAITQARLMSSGPQETDAEFDARYEAYFNRPDIDGWEIRKAMGELGGMDLCPEPVIVAAALRACRRVNDYSLTTRILEVVRLKCAPNMKEMWPYMMQELKPTMDELGISSLEEMGYDVPELMLPNPYEIHGESDDSTTPSSDGNYHPGEPPRSPLDKDTWPGK